MKVITSADNSRYKMLLRLAHSARERRKAGLSLLDGVHLVNAFRQSVGEPVLVAVSAEGFNNSEIAGIANGLGNITPMLLSDALFRKLSSVESPTGIVAAVKTPLSVYKPESATACVLLEGVQDPGNLGSILRSVSAAGMADAYLSKGCADAWSPRVLRAGMGAHFSLRIHELVDFMEFYKHYRGRLIATSQAAPRSLFATDLTGSVGLIFGNEGAGLSPAVRRLAHSDVAIPMPGTAESLNIGAAVAIFLFERVRQELNLYNAQQQTE